MKSPDDRLRFAALLALTVHLVAGLGMVVVLRHGLETNPDFQQRLGFLADHRTMWTLAWLTWTAAALSILYFYLAFASAHEAGDDAPMPALRLAVLLTAAAIAPDLAAQAIEIGVLPTVAERALNTNTGVDRFLVLHRTAVMLSGYVANGLYSLSAMILAWTTRRAYPFWVWIAGVVVGTSGLTLSIAALVDSIRGMLWSNVVLVPCILAWLAGVAYLGRGKPH